MNSPLNDMLRPCTSCGETGRIKASTNHGRSREIYCHDEEKSCYYYTYLQELNRRVG